MSSGGLDSSLVMALLKEEGVEVFPLHINYGHLAERKEWEACLKICAALGLRPPEKMDLAGMSNLPSGLTDPNLDTAKYAFLPTRNLLLLVAGAAYAYSKGLDAVAIGLVANPIFPDQTKEFVESSEKTLSIALGRRVRLLAPLIGLDKREVILLARKHNLPFALTYYCHRGQDEACGECISCRERKAAEAALGGEYGYPPIGGGDLS